MVIVSPGLCQLISEGIVSVSPNDIPLSRKCWFCDQLRMLLLIGSNVSQSDDLPLYCCEKCRLRFDFLDPLDNTDIEGSHDLVSQHLATVINTDRQENLLTMLQHLRVVQICADRANTRGVVCNICKDDLMSTDYAVQLPCRHIFHKNCICPWFKYRRSCPTCRYEIEFF